MFKALKQMLSESFGAPKATQKFLVADKKEIITLLKQVHAEKVFLTLRIGKVEKPFSTALLGIYPDHDLIVLDEVSPSDGHKHFLQNKKALVTGRVNGIELRFNIDLLEAGSKSNIAFYKVAMPAKVYFRQQRESYRVSLKGANAAFFSSGDSHIPTMHGFLLDLSLGGIGVILDHKVSLSRGDELKLCTITIPKQGDVKFSLLVDAVRDNPRGGGMSFGGHFCSLPKAEQTMLQKYIALIQREQARKSR